MTARTAATVERYCIDCGYSLKGLPSARCPECGQAFEEEDPRTWAAWPNQVNAHGPLAASFLGTVVGWAIGYAVNTIYEAYTSPSGIAMDRHAAMVATAFAAMTWWWFVAMPAIVLSGSLRRLGSRLIATLVGAIGGLCGLWILLGLGPLRGISVEEAIRSSVWAAVVGSCAGFAASLASQKSWVRSAAGIPRRVAVGLWTAGPLAVLLWLFLLWPIVCAIAPDLAYRVGGYKTRNRALQTLLQRVQVGDDVREIERLRLHPVDPGSANASKHDRWSGRIFLEGYAFEVQDGQITAIEREIADVAE
jgi:hypothetical protein